MDNWTKWAKWVGAGAIVLASVAGCSNSGSGDNTADNTAPLASNTAPVGNASDTNGIGNGASTGNAVGNAASTGNALGNAATGNAVGNAATGNATTKGPNMMKKGPMGHGGPVPKMNKKAP